MTTSALSSLLRTVVSKVYSYNSLDSQLNFQRWEGKYTRMEIFLILTFSPKALIMFGPATCVSILDLVEGVCI